MGQPQSSRAYRIGPAAMDNAQNTLTNGQSYPSANGIRPDYMVGLLDQDSDTCVAGMLQGGLATFGTATLQRQLSFDQINWINDGAAVSAATPVAVSMYRNCWYRWTVTGTGDITGAQLYCG